MGLKDWFKDQREQALADPIVTTFNGGDRPLALYTHSIRSGGETIPLTEVELHLESGEELQSRVTVTRLLALHIFAFALKKKRGGEKYLTIESPDQFITIEIPRKKVGDAVKFMGAVHAQAKRESLSQA